MVDTAKRVLLVKTSSMGDVVHALPAVSDAAAHGHQIDWVVEEAFADVAGLHPDVHEVIPVAVRRWRKNPVASRTEIKQFVARLREVKYDLVLDSQGLIKSALLTLFARGPSVGFSHTTAREPLAALTYRRHCMVPKGQHAVLRQRQLFSQALNYSLPEPICAIGTPPQHSKPRWCFCMAPLGQQNIGRNRCGRSWPSSLKLAVIRCC